MLVEGRIIVKPVRISVGYMDKTISVERAKLARELYRRKNADFLWYLLSRKNAGFQIFAIEYIIRLGKGCSQIDTMHLMNKISEEKRNAELAAKTQPFIKTSDDG